MNKVDDLFIMLRAVDRTKTAFGKVFNRMEKMDRIQRRLARGATAMGAALVGALGLALVNGKRLTDELRLLGQQTDISTREAQALFQAVQDAAGDFELDNLTEALLSVKERFADARVGAGPLLGLLQDFKEFNLDLGVDNARDQLADFLEQVAKLDDANDRIFALKEVIGDEDARPFFKIINNTEKLNQLLVDLRTNVDDLPDILEQHQIDRLDEAKASALALNAAWDQFSINLAVLVAPIREAINEIFLALTEGADMVVKGLLNAEDTAKKLFSAGVAGLSNIVAAGRAVPEFLSNVFSGKPLADLERFREEWTSIFGENGIVNRTANTPGGLVVDVVGDSGEDSVTRDFFPDRASAGYQTAVNKELDRQKGLQIKARQEAHLENLKLIEEQEEERKRLVLETAEKARQEFFDNLIPNAKLKDRSPQSFFDDEDALFAAPAVDNAAIVERAMERMADAVKKRKMEMREGLLSIGSAFGELAGLAAGKSEKAFKVFQRIQIAISTVAAFSAAVQSLAEAKGDPLLRLAAYARILGVGLSAIAQMRKVNVGGSTSAAGSGSPGSAGAPSVSAPGARGGTAEREAEQQARGDTYNITFEGEDSDTTTIGAVREFINLLNRNESERRGLQFVLGN